jgi:hypothetical protein
VTTSVFVRQPPHQTAARHTLAPAAVAPAVRFSDAACQHSTIPVEALTGHDQAQLVQPTEHGQVM